MRRRRPGVENHSLSFTQVTWAPATSACQACKLPPSESCDQFNADFSLRKCGSMPEGCLHLASRPRRGGRPVLEGRLWRRQPELLW